MAVFRIILGLESAVSRCRSRAKYIPVSYPWPRHTACTSPRVCDRALGNICSVTFLSMQAHAAQKQRGESHRAAQPLLLSIDMAAVNNPSQADTALGGKGAPVVRAQILLARAHFSCGEIDADFGSNLDRAVRAFQADRKLPVTGVVRKNNFQTLEPMFANSSQTNSDVWYS